MRFGGNICDIPHMGMQGGQSAQTPDQTNTISGEKNTFILLTLTEWLMIIM